MSLFVDHEVPLPLRYGPSGGSQASAAIGNGVLVTIRDGRVTTVAKPNLG